MSIIRHPIWQYAYFVNDIDEACRKWNKMVGAGPFHVVRHHIAESFRYRGSPWRPTSATPSARPGRPTFSSSPSMTTRPPSTGRCTRKGSMASTMSAC